MGVDVFFVISGFLMALLISNEIDDSDFSLLRFYERRVRRIFPALFAMFAATSVGAWLWLMPVEFNFFGRSLKAAALFYSNVEFNKENDYFDIGAQMKPLLHTWSLSVEEQFYILFPILMLCITRFLPRHRSAVLGGLLALSFAASTWVVFSNPGPAFYLLQFRAWELLLGAVISLRAVPHPENAAQRGINAGIGCTLIAAAVVSYTDKTLFPGPAALLPCIGAALVINAQAESGLTVRMLGSTPLRFTGLISYSLYLWHWPLIVFTKEVLGRELNSIERVAIIAASFAAAVVSWRFIEQPFLAQRRHVGLRPLIAGAALLMIGAVTFGSGVARDGGVPSRLQPDIQKIYSATYDMSRYGVPPCFVDDQGGPSAADIRTGMLCVVGQSNMTPSFIVWGDSHSGAMTPAIEVAANSVNVAGLFAGHSSCPPLPGVQLSTRGDTQRCGDFNSAVLDLIASKHIPLVFLVAYWPKYVLDSELPNEGAFFDPSVAPPLEDKSAPVRAALENLMTILTKLGTKVVLVHDVPEMGRYMPEAVAKAVRDKSSLDLAPPWSYTIKRQALARQMLGESASKFGAVIVDPLSAICSNDQCNAVRNGMPLYKDADHITSTFSKTMSYLFKPVLDDH